MGEAKDTPYRTLLHTLQGHQAEINRIAWSPDGQRLASASFDMTVRIWDTQAGELEQTLRGHSGSVYSVAWSPDGQTLASGSQDRSLLIWDARTQKYLFSPTRQHDGSIYDLIWLSSDKTIIISCSEDQNVKVWESDRSSRFLAQRGVFSGHASEIYCLAYSPDRNILVSGSSQGPLRYWDVSRIKNDTIHRYRAPLEFDKPFYTARTHGGAVNSLAWSPDGQILASGSEDHTVKVENRNEEFEVRVASKHYRTYTLEGHTGAITSVSFSYDGRLLASKSRDGTIRLWRTDTWELVDTIEASASNGIFAGLAFHPTQPLLASASEGDRAIQVWHLNIPGLLGLVPPQLTVHYVNAKVVLAGDSGVGKTALGRALVGLPYLPTDSSPGRFIYNFKSYTVDLAENRQEQREVFLWDLAGQSGSRLVHQLHLPEAAVVALIFSDMSGDPLTGIRYWGRALRAVQDRQGDSGWPVTKLLVEARTDRGGVRLSREQIESTLREWGLSQYYRTSAQTTEGVNELASAIEEAISWDLLPRVSSTELFQSIKTFLIERKKAGYVIESASNLYRAFVEFARFTEEPAHLNAQFETCIGHLDAQGLLRRLSFGGFVLLFPEKLDEYADTLVKEVRTKADQLGSIAEAEVLAGNFNLPEKIRLPDREDERILLLALIQDLLKYEIALRESSYLVFPSEVMRQPQVTDRQESLTRSVLFTFEGPVLNIYATLAVRLAHSGFFRNQELWQNCMVYTAQMGGTCRCELSEAIPGEGKGELALFFDAQASEETRYHFETYIQAHLQRYVGEERVQRQRVYVCPVCQTPLSDEQIKRGRDLGRPMLACPMMDDGRIDIRDGLGRLTQAPDSRVQEQMQREADLRRERSVARSVFLSKELVQHHDVYVSYHRQDEQSARMVREALRDRGYNAWLVDWNSIPGLPRQSQVEETIKQMRAAVALIGKHEMDRQRELEVAAMMEEFKRRGCPVIPVFLADAPQNSPIPAFLQNMAEVDFRRQEPDPLERLIMGIENKRI